MLDTTKGVRTHNVFSLHMELCRSVRVPMPAHVYFRKRNGKRWPGLITWGRDVTTMHLQKKCKQSSGQFSEKLWALSIIWMFKMTHTTYLNIVAV